MSRQPAAILAGLLALCGALIGLGTLEANVSLDSVADLWGDTLRDADEGAARLASVRPADEAAMGARQATVMMSAYNEDPVDSAYVSAVGALLLGAGRRPDFPYVFHVIETWEPNAFALPGGQIFVTRGMMNLLKTEAELASVLGHEIGHVELGHCRARFRYQLAMKRVGAASTGQILDELRGPLRMAFSQDQELDADAYGVGRAGAAGYDRAAATAVHARMAAELGASGVAGPAGRTPAGEIGGAVVGLVTGYFQSHPSWPERIERLNGLARGGGYEGKRNFELRQPKSEAQYGVSSQ